MLRVLDLFSGIGGFSLGLERGGGFETVAFCEINRRANAVLQKRWPNVDRLEDVRALERGAIPGAIDAIVMGWPCQDISSAGPGSGLTGERSALFWSGLQAIRLVRPAIALLENVAALLGRGMGSVLGALAEEGYDSEWDCIRAVDVGRPHKRERVFVAAYAAGDRWGPGRPGGLADGLAGLPIQPCWSGDPVAFFEERSAQPALLGMDDGFPGGLDRLNLCGNAVVPQIPEIIGRAILAAEAA